MIQFVSSRELLSERSLFRTCGSTVIMCCGCVRRPENLIRHGLFSAIAIWFMLAQCLGALAAVFFVKL